MVFIDPEILQLLDSSDHSFYIFNLIPPQQRGFILPSDYLARKGDFRVPLVGHRINDYGRLFLELSYYDRDPWLYDPRLFIGDLSKGITQYIHMVIADIGDQGN